MIEFHQPSEDDRRTIVELAKLAFPVPTGHLEDHVARIRLDRYLGAYESGRLIATAQAHPLQQWFGGQPIACSGIASVTAAPELRGMGIVTRLMREFLVLERERGAVLSALYPATVPVYRRLGYEYAGTYTQYGVKLRTLPGGSAGVVNAFDQDDPEPLRECFRRVASGHNGLIDCESEDWWPRRILRRVGPDVVAHAIVVRGADGIGGYAAFTREDLPQDYGFRLACTHLVATTRAALESLLSYFRRFQGIGRELRWQGPPNDPVAFLLDEQSLEATFTFRFMMRILDVRGALESRGYPEVDGEATIAVADDLFPENSGAFDLVAEGGKVRAAASGRTTLAAPIPIGALSALYSGYVTPADLVRLDLMDASDPALPVLARLFAGPPPWMPDFF